MNHCLFIPEVLHSVCHELGAKDTLSAALTCRSFLEPALDKLWFHINSFKPFLCCLPEGLLLEQSLPPPQQEYKFLVPRSAIGTHHLQRYMVNYSRRIRSFASPEFYAEVCLPSLELLLALQFATGYERGALSPLLRRLDWQYCHLHELNAKSNVNLSVFLHFFLGDNVEILSLPPLIRSTENPLQHASVEANTKAICHRIKELTLSVVYEHETLESYITSYRWDALEVLKLAAFSTSLLPYVARLPQLRFLQIWETDEMEGHLHRLEEPSSTPRPADFPRLRTLSLRMCKAEGSVWCFLKHLPPSNELERVEIMSELRSNSDVCRGAISAIKSQCNPSHLRAIVLSDDEEDPFWQTPPEAGPVDDASGEEPIDISPLFSFTGLEHLSVKWWPYCRITRQHTFDGAKAWPNMRLLDLCSPYYSNGRIPAVDHTDLIAILNACPLLVFLGLRFDATQLTGMEESPDRPFRKLVTLRVGDSPISSPSRVAHFLKTYLPRLSRLDTRYQSPRDEMPTLYDRRWGDVLKELGL